MNLYFITSNKNKFEEVKSIIPQVNQLDIDLTEIQSLDPHNIIKHKVQEAFKHHQGAFIVEDTSLYIKNMNGLPGPLVKLFLKSLDTDGVYYLTKAFGSAAHAQVLIGYATGPDDVVYFEGSIEGTIVEPLGEHGFGWDSIFQPTDFDKTFAQMTSEEKTKVSMRGKAVHKLKEYLEQSKTYNL